jgi:hypothetical protein
MATAQEKQDLIEVLRAGINKYTITLYGYGGEIAVGSITPEQYQYWQNRDLCELADDWDNELDVDEDLRIFSNSSWYECDDLAHEFGVEFSDLCTVVVENEAGNPVWSSALGSAALEESGVDPGGFAHDEFYVRFDSAATHAFVGQIVEKGTFYTGEFETYGRFQPAKLSFSIIDIEGWQLVNGVSYESVIVEDTGGMDTRGKSREFQVFAVESQGAAV